jgi:hypothetical protein
MENDFTKYIMSKVQDVKANPKRLLGGISEGASWYFNRAPDQADIFSKPGIRNKINAGVGTGLVELANFGKDALEEMAVNAASAALIPETGGASSLGFLPKVINPLKAGINFATDMAMDDFVNPMLYDLADNAINIGGRLPKAPSWYKGSATQKAVNTVDKKITDFASFVSKTHPQTLLLNNAAKYGDKAGLAASKAKDKITKIR